MASFVEFREQFVVFLIGSRRGDDKRLTAFGARNLAPLLVAAFERQASWQAGQRTEIDPLMGYLGGNSFVLLPGRLRRSNVRPETAAAFPGKVALMVDTIPVIAEGQAACRLQTTRRPSA